MRNAKFKIQNAKCKMQKDEHGAYVAAVRAALSFEL
jgi:hypothetical protein